MRRQTMLFVLGAQIVVPACTEVPWNNPYPATDAEQNILYDSFSERPNHLDPVRAYSANEYVFIAQIYRKSQQSGGRASQAVADKEQFADAV